VRRATIVMCPILLLQLAFVMLATTVPVLPTDQTQQMAPQEMSVLWAVIVHKVQPVYNLNAHRELTVTELVYRASMSVNRAQRGTIARQMVFMSLLVHVLQGISVHLVKIVALHTHAALGTIVGKARGT